MKKDELVKAIVDRVERMVDMLPDEDGSIDVKVVLTNGEDKVVTVNCELFDLEDGSWDEEDMKKEECLNTNDTSRWVEDENDVIECDEFALHDVICELGNLKFGCNDDGDIVDRIRLNHVDDALEEADREMLEKKVNDLLKCIRDVDCFLHDVAEYTCR